ncbi:hypothetical protein Hte_004773 [Hypoxylon texense]
MSKIETLATQSPMNARIMALDTIAKEMQTVPAFREVLYGEGRLPLPAISNEDWYTGLGYNTFKKEKEAFVSEPKNGVRVPIDLVYMKKAIV